MASHTNPLESLVKEELYQEIISDVVSIYNSNIKQTSQMYRHYSNNAEFEDPLQYCEDLRSIKSTFGSLPKLFKGRQVLQFTGYLTSISMLKIELRLKYFWAVKSKETVMDTIVLLTLENGKIVTHEERWESGFTF